MNCPTCRETHESETYTYREGNRQYTGHRWAARS